MATRAGHTGEDHCIQGFFSHYFTADDCLLLGLHCRTDLGLFHESTEDTDGKEDSVGCCCSWRCVGGVGGMMSTRDDDEEHVFWIFYTLLYVKHHS